MLMRQEVRKASFVASVVFSVDQKIKRAIKRRLTYHT